MTSALHDIVSAAKGAARRDECPKVQVSVRRPLQGDVTTPPAGKHMCEGAEREPPLPPPVVLESRAERQREQQLRRREQEEVVKGVVEALSMIDDFPPLK
ncbi:hypothetical protein N2152v2_004111 [Parachlorella kessleri]